MAEVLIKAIDATNPDPAVDAMCYKQRDPVVVMPNGHPWGVMERDTSKFWIVLIPDATVEQVRKYLDAEYDEVTAQPRRRRKYLCDINLNTSTLRALNEGPVTYSWADVQKFLRNKVTGLTAEQGG